MCGGGLDRKRGNMGDLSCISMHVHIVLYFHHFFLVVALEVTADSWDDIGGFKKKPDT